MPTSRSVGPEWCRSSRPHSATDCYSTTVAYRWPRRSWATSRSQVASAASDAGVAFRGLLCIGCTACTTGK